MECSKCGKPITVAYHFYQCSACGSFYHRSKCIVPAVSASIFKEIKTREWTCVEGNQKCKSANPTFLEHDSINKISESYFEESNNGEENTLNIKLCLEELVPAEFFKAKGLILCHLNANSIRNKFDEINVLLHGKNVSLLACTESKLDRYRDSNAQYSIIGFL